MGALHSKALASFPILILAADGCVIYLPGREHPRGLGSHLSDNTDKTRPSTRTDTQKPHRSGAKSRQDLTGGDVF